MPAKDLADQGPGQLLDLHNAAGNLVRGQLIADVGAQPFGVEPASGLEHHGCDHIFAAARALHAHHGGVFHRFVALQCFLHLGGRDVEPAGDDQFLDPVPDGDKAILVRGDNIAGTEPSAVEHCRFRFLGLVPVALENLRALDQQFTGSTRLHVNIGVFRVDNADVRQGERHAHGTGFAAGCKRVAQRHGRGFRQPVPFNQVPAGGGFPGFDCLQRQVHGPGNGEPDPPQGNALLRSGFGQPVIDGRHSGQEGGRRLFHGFERQVNIELREQHQPGTQAHGAGQAEGQAVGVEHRQHGVEGFLPRPQPGNPGDPLRGVGHQVRMREHGALGVCGGSAGVLDGRKIGRFGTGVPAPQRTGVQQGLPGEHLAPSAAQFRFRGEGSTGLACLGDGQFEGDPVGKRHGVDQVDGHDGPYGDVRRQVLDLLRRLVPDNGHRGAVVLKEVPEFAVGVQRVVFDHHRAEAQHRVERNHMLRRVGQHQRYPVAFADAQLEQSCRGPADLLSQFLITGGRTKELQCRLGFKLADRCLHHVHQGTFRQTEVLHDPLAVVAGPRAVRIRKRVVFAHVIDFSPCPPLT